MSKYFSIATGATNPAQERAFKDAIKGKGWWHWLANYWLIKDQSETLTARPLRDLFKQACPGVNCMVLEIEPKTWSSMGIKKEGSGRDWLRGNWPPEGQ